MKNAVKDSKHYNKFRLGYRTYATAFLCFLVMFIYNYTKDPAPKPKNLFITERQIYTSQNISGVIYEGEILNSTFNESTETNRPIEQSFADQKMAHIKRIWIGAVHENSYGGTLTELDIIRRDPDSRVAELAEKAIGDLRNLEKLQNPSLDGYVINEEKEIEITDLSSEQIVADIYFEADVEKRFSKISSLALHHSDNILVALNQFAYDSDPDIRYKVINALWSASASAGNVTSETIDVLNQSSVDRNDRVATLAKMALDDLKNLGLLL